MKIYLSGFGRGDRRALRDMLSGDFKMSDEKAAVFVPKVKRVVTLPLLKMAVGVTVHAKMLTKMYIGKDMKQKEGDKKKEPATLIDVVDLTTGEPAQIIVSAVVKSVLSEEYPNDSYVGKCFSITKQTRVPGKGYDPFRVVEIEDPTEDANPNTAAKSASGTKK